MTLINYLGASALLALAVMAPISEGPMDLFILALFPWGLSALYAFAARNYQSSFAKYGGPLMVLILMAGIMFLGSP